ncbi:MAG: peptidoglycan-binding protein LysM [Thiotrichales bacterium]
MGLFDFAASMGKKLFGKEDDPAKKIGDHIKTDNPGIDDLEVSYEEGKVVLSGKADSPEAAEKAILMAGNVEGVSAVDSSGITAPVQTAKVEFYVIQKGDTLSAIAKKYLGSASKYPEIFEANREVIKDPDLIYPGQTIRIPLD